MQWAGAIDGIVPNAKELVEYHTVHIRKRNGGRSKCHSQQNGENQSQTEHKNQDKIQRRFLNQRLLIFLHMRPYFASCSAISG